MQDPQPQLQALSQEGRQLWESLGRHVPTRGTQRVAVQAGTRFLASVLEAPELRSPIARWVGNAMVASNAAQKEAQLVSYIRNWEARARQFLNTISVARSNLGPRGNSAELVGRFSSAQTGAKTQTKLSRAVRFLERLDGQQLVFNGDIPQMLKQRAIQKANDARLSAELRLIDIPEIAPGFDHLKFPNRAALHARLGAFPEERQMIEGAMDAFLGDGPDRFRQALASARNAIESMAKRITGAEKWREGIATVAGESTKNIFRDAFAFLSSRGSHAGKPPSKTDAELGIQQAISCILWLIGHQDLFRNASAQTV